MSSPAPPSSPPITETEKDDEPSQASPVTITSDEVNYLVYRYLQESGFVHSSFTFAYESLLTKSSSVNTPLPPGALITFLQKGLQYLAIEEHVAPDGKEKVCVEEFTLLSPAVCGRLAGGVTKSPRQVYSTVPAPPPVAGGGPDGQAPQQQVVAKGQEGGGGQQGLDDAMTATSAVVLSGHTSEVFMCKWNNVKPSLIATGSGDSTARIWDSANPNLPPVVLRHAEVSGEKNKDVTTLEWSPSGDLLATGSYDGVARVWAMDGSVKYTLAFHRGPIFSLKWNHDGTRLLSGSYDKSTIVWDMANGTRECQFEVHDAPALDVDWNGTDVFASCSTDKTVAVCKVRVSKASSLTSPADSSLAQSSDAMTDDAVVPVAFAYNEYDTTPVYKFVGHTDEVNAVNWDPSGTLLASCSDDGTAKVWKIDKAVLDTATACQTETTPIWTFAAHTKEVYTSKWSPTGPGSANPSKPLLLATASFDNDVRLWSVVEGTCIHRLSRHTDPVYSVSFSPSAEFLASGSLAGKLYIWDVKTGEVDTSYTGKGDIFEVGFDVTEKKVAACFSSNIVSIVDFNPKGRA